MQAWSDAPHTATVGDLMASVHPSLRGMVMAGMRPDPLEGLRISVHASPAEAARQMLSSGSWMLVIVDDEKHLVGMILRDQLTASRRRPHPPRGVSPTMAS